MDNKATAKTRVIRSDVPVPPKGKETLKWLGPGLLWMVSSVGSGSVLFTPRIGSHYTYQLLWLAITVCFLMWFMIREAGRYSVVTGETLLKGVSRLSDKNNNIIWLIFIPQIAAAIAGVAGLSALVGSACKTAFGGNHVIWGCGFIVFSMLLVISGRYKGVEKASQLLAGILIAITALAAYKVVPSLKEFSTGLKFSIPGDAEIYVVVPWVGTILAGSMGILWFSYWSAKRGYGGGMIVNDDQLRFLSDNEEPDIRVKEKLQKWFSVLSSSAAVGVAVGLIVIICFLILGSELLAPKGIVPKGIDVAKDLSGLLEEIWGKAGFWMMIVAVLVALGGSIFANQDGWGRSFADMNFIMASNGSFTKKWISKTKNKFSFYTSGQKVLKDFYVLFITGIIPVIVILLFKDPVTIMSVSGIVAAIHTPFLVILTLLVNLKLLPKVFKPKPVTSIVIIFAALFYSAFGAMQLYSTFTGNN